VTQERPYDPDDFLTVFHAHFSTSPGAVTCKDCGQVWPWSRKHVITIGEQCEILTHADRHHPTDALANG
jgi:hypothetical protein